MANKKKLVSLVMALVLALSLLPTAAFAKKNDASVRISGSSSVTVGSTISLTAATENFSERPSNIYYTWSTSNAGVAAIRGGGYGGSSAAVTGVAAGSATITVSAEGWYLGRSASASFTVTVKAAAASTAGIVATVKETAENTTSAGLNEIKVHYEDKDGKSLSLGTGAVTSFSFPGSTLTIGKDTFAQPAGVIDGYVFDSAYFYWGGESLNSAGGKYTITAFTNKGTKSVNYPGYNSYLGFQRASGSTDDWKDGSNLYAYNPTGVLHLVYDEVAVANPYNIYWYTKDSAGTYNLADTTQAATEDEGQTYTFVSTASQPADYTADGYTYTFDHWSTSKDTDTRSAYKAGDVITSDVYLYAVYTATKIPETDTTSWPIRFYLQDVTGNTNYTYTDTFGGLDVYLSNGFACVGTAAGSADLLTSTLTGSTAVENWLASNHITSPVTTGTVAATLQGLINKGYITGSTVVCGSYTASYVINHAADFRIVYTQASQNFDALKTYTAGNVEYVGINRAPWQRSYHVHLKVVQNSYTVTYKVDGVQDGAAESYAYGANVTLRSQPSKAGATFSGWSSNDVSVSSGSFQMPDRNVTISGTFANDLYTVTYAGGTHGALTGADANGNVAHADCAYGSGTPAAPAVTANAGYYFTGWDPTIAATVTQDVVYTAQYAERGALVVTANSGTVTYNGTAQTVTGFTTNAPAGTVFDTAGITAAGSGTNAGSYDVVFNGAQPATLTDQNGKVYDVTYAKGTLTIGKISTPLVITAGSATRLYDGTALTNSHYTYTPDVLVGGDVLVVGVSGSQTNAGSSENTVSSYSVRRGNTDVTANYAAISTTPGTLQVNPRTVTLTSETANKVFDGSALVKPVVQVTDDGFVAGEVSELRATGSVTNVSEGAVENAISYTRNSGFAAANYNITTNVGILTITPITDAVTVTVTGHHDSATYNGSAQSVSGYDLSSSNPLYSGENVSFAGTSSASRTDVGTTNMGLAASQFSNASANFSNVTFRVTDGFMTVTAKAVTVRANDKTKTFGAADPAFDAEVTGLLGSDTVIYTLGRAAGDTENVGSHDILAAGDAAQGNYAVSYVKGTLTITPADMSGVTAEGSETTYDGAKHSIRVYAPEGATVTYSASATGTYGTENPAYTDAGTHTVYYKVEKANYNDVTGSAVVTIRPVAIVLTARSGEKTYDGTALTAEGYTVTTGKFVGTEGVAGVTVSGSQTNVGSSKNEITAYTLQENTKAINYSVTTAAGTLKVNPKAVTVKADNKTIYYGSQSPALTATVTGTIGSDTVNYSLSREQGTATGSYAITPTGAAAQGNYVVTYQNGTLRIYPNLTPVIPPEEDIGDDDVPKAELPSDLNTTDHFQYIYGYGDGTFRPRGNITRAEVTTIFYRLLLADKRDEIFTTTNSFSDVTPDLWYNKAASSMANGGYTTGYSDGTFRGSKAITRAEFVAIAARFVGVAAGDVSFSDVSEGFWAYDYISTAVANGWIQGYSDGTFRPNQKITRAEAITIINRMLDRGVDKAGLLTGIHEWPDCSAAMGCYYEVAEATNSHLYTGSRPSETWTSLKIDYQYDLVKYERPDAK